VRAQRVFLSQAGPRFDSEHFKLSITFGSRNKKDDPLGRPRLARYAAKKLARTPPSEG
jgi:hypothetical protein